MVNKCICPFVSCPPYFLISISLSVEFQGFMTSRTSFYFEQLPVIWWPVALRLSFMKPINVAEGHMTLEPSVQQEQHWKHLRCLLSLQTKVSDHPGERLKTNSVVHFQTIKVLIQVLTGSWNCRSTPPQSFFWEGGVAQVHHLLGFMSLTSPVCLAGFDPWQESTAADKGGQSELMCVFDPLKQNSRHCSQQMAQWCFCPKPAQVNACQSWGKWGWKDRGGGKLSHTKATCLSAGSGYLTCRFLLLSEQPELWVVFFS